MFKSRAAYNGARTVFFYNIVSKKATQFDVH